MGMSARQSTGLRNWLRAMLLRPPSRPWRSTPRSSQNRIQIFPNNRNKERISRRIRKGVQRGALLFYCYCEYALDETVNLHEAGSRAALREVLLDLRTSSVRRQSACPGNFSRIVCGPAGSFSVAGALPRNCPRFVKIPAGKILLERRYAGRHTIQFHRCACRCARDLQLVACSARWATQQEPSGAKCELRPVSHERTPQ